MRMVSVAALLAVFATSTGAPSSGLVDPYIVGGSDIDIDKAPYQISIEQFRFHICGGAIISENWALTAAQCVHPATSGWSWGKRIRAGSRTEIPVVGWGGTTHNIAESVPHPSFHAALLDYDVAVVRVAKAFDWTSRVQPVPLPAITETEDAGLSYSNNATIAGWGLTSAGGFFRAWYLKSVDIVLTRRALCALRFQQKGLQVEITSRVICAAGNGQGGPCKGDYGSGLVQNKKLVGLFSWYKGKCNDNELPVGFTNLYDKEIRSFIKTRTNK